MELRKFKHWLLDNNFEEDQLYQESIRCYQVEAYRAAYIFSYLANHKYISKLAIEYRGVPTNFMSKCPNIEVRKKRWQEKVSYLQNEDKWEETVTNILIQAKEEDNIFKLPIKIKEKYSHMRVLRNNAAHAKDRQIAESTVLELWNDIVYTYPYFFVNGTKESWLEDLDKLVKYSNDNGEFNNELLGKFNNFPLDTKVYIIKKIVDKYLCNLDLTASLSEPVLIILSTIFQENQLDKNLTLFSESEEIYLALATGVYIPKSKRIDIFLELENQMIDFNFRNLCDDLSVNFWKFIDYLSMEIDENQIVDLIMNLLENSYRVFDETKIKNIQFLTSSTVLLQKILERVERLYYYRMNATGQKRYGTSTFDYSRFTECFHFVKYLMFRISMDSNLKEDPKIDNFLQRCSTLLENEYSINDHSNNSMKEFIIEYNNLYKVIKEKSI